MLRNTILIYDSVDYFIPYMEAKGVKCFPSFKPIDKKLKFLRKISLTLKVLRPHWYGGWKSNLKNVDTVIIFASNRYDFIEYLCDQNPRIRVIVWYWNPVSKCFDPNHLKRNNLEYWSFDLEDCKRFNLKHNSTFYFDNIEIGYESRDVDVLFVGADKGRKVFIEEIRQGLKKRGLRPFFHIVPDRGASNPSNIKTIPYQEYLNHVSSCIALLDFLQEGQSGQTLRPLEAIFFQKKLITNDKTIAAQIFYNPHNIFILDLDNLDNLVQFITSEYYPLDKKIVEYFDFSNWLARFNMMEEENE